MMLAFFHEDGHSPVPRHFSKIIQSGSTIELSQILIIETGISSQPWAFLVSSVLINFKTLSLFTVISFSRLLILGRKVGKELVLCIVEHTKCRSQ